MADFAVTYPRKLGFKTTAQEALDGANLSGIHSTHICYIIHKYYKVLYLYCII